MAKNTKDLFRGKEMFQKWLVAQLCKFTKKHWRISLNSVLLTIIAISAFVKIHKNPILMLDFKITLCSARQCWVEQSGSREHCILLPPHSFKLYIAEEIWTKSWSRILHLSFKTYQKKYTFFKLFFRGLLCPHYLTIIVVFYEILYQRSEYTI